MWFALASALLCFASLLFFAGVDRQTPRRLHDFWQLSFFWLRALWWATSVFLLLVLLDALVTGLCAARSVDIPELWYRLAHEWLFLPKSNRLAYASTVLLLTPLVIGVGWAKRPPKATLPQAPVSTSRKSLKTLAKVHRALSKGQRLKAAKLLSTLGPEHAFRAGALFDEEGHSSAAANAFQRAGEYFSLRKDYFMAAKSYLKASQTEFAISLFQRIPFDSLNPALREEYINLYGKALLISGHSDLAGHFFAKHNQWAKAAAAYEQARDLEKAGKAYSKAGEHEQSARILLESGIFDLARMEQCRALEKKGNFLDAARCYEKNGMFLDAANLFQRMRQPLQAAKCLEQANVLEKAIPLYTEAGDDESVLRLYLQLGEPAQAAAYAGQVGMKERQGPLFLQAGDPLHALHSFVNCEQWDLLADLLQQPQHASILAPQLSSTLLQLLSSRQTGRFQQLMALAIRHFPISAASWPLFAKIADFKASQGYWASAAELLISIWPVADQTETLHKKLSLYCQKAGLPGDSLPAMSAAAAATRLEETKAGETHAPAELQDTLTFDANFMVDLTQEKDLERFEFIREIGQGGMGKVYLCRDRKLNRQVAFKTVHPYLNQDPNTLLFFKREAQFVAQLNHPNIVTLYDVGFRRGCYFLVMEYVHGTHLGQLHRTHPEYIRKHFLALWYETCLGLQAAHDHEVLHRDIKPANIMVSKDRRLKVMDFGLAKKENDPSLSDRRWVTPAFSAPEVIQGNRATYTSDIFSLGATFYFLASGEKPLFEGNEHMKLRSIRVVAPRINDSLADCIDKCLHLDPDHRYQSVKELLLALKLLSSMKIEPFQSSPAKND